MSREFIQGGCLWPCVHVFPTGAGFSKKLPDQKAIKDVNEPRNICDVRSIPILMNDQNPTEQTSARMQYTYNTKTVVPRFGDVNSHDTPSVYLLRQHAQLHRHHAILVVLLNIGFLHGISNTAPILPVQRARLAYLAHILVPPPW